MYLDNTAYLCKELLLGVGKVIEKCKNENSDIIESIRNTGKLDDENEKKLSEVISSLKSNMK